MRFVFALVSLAALSACVPSTTGVLGWAENTGFGHLGTSVVCLGASDGNASPDADGAWRIHGTVVSEGDDTRDIGSLEPCWRAPSRVLTVEDEAGITWQVGYRWQSDSLGDVTPTLHAEPGEAVDVLLRPGTSAQANGFAAFRGEELVYAMESGRGSSALANGDIPNLQVTGGERISGGDDGCGAVDAVVMEFLTTSGDTASLAPGEDSPLEVDEGDPMTLCNIDSFEYDPAQRTCSDGVPETSWVMFK